MVLQLDANLPKPEEELITHVERNTSAFIKEKDLGKGTLFIAKNRLSWLADDGQGLSLEYPSISLHAISKDLESFPRECIYLMVESSEGGSDSESSESGEDHNVVEVRFVPEDKNNLDAMFRTMSECQSLHPDPTDSLSEEGGDEDEDEEEDIFEDAEDTGAGDAMANVSVEYNVAEAERLLGIPDNNGVEEDGEGHEAMDVTPGQFEDAEQ